MYYFLTINYVSKSILIKVGVVEIVQIKVAVVYYIYIIETDLEELGNVILK